MNHYYYKLLYSHILIQNQYSNLNTYIEQHTHTQQKTMNKVNANYINNAVRPYKLTP